MQLAQEQQPGQIGIRPGCLLGSGVDVARAPRRVIEPAFIEEIFDEGDHRALIVGGEVRRASEPRQEARGARSREIVADWREP